MQAADQVAWAVSGLARAIKCVASDSIKVCWGVRVSLMPGAASTLRGEAARGHRGASARRAGPPQRGHLGVACTGDQREYY